LNKKEFIYTQQIMPQNLIDKPSPSQISQINEVRDAIKTRVEQNVFMPITHVLRNLFKSSDKRLKFFAKACNDERYRAIFDIELDKWKVSYFNHFFKKYTIPLEAEELFKGMFDFEEWDEHQAPPALPGQGIIKDNTMAYMKGQGEGIKPAP
jgi:hypothetical protein